MSAQPAHLRKSGKGRKNKDTADETAGKCFHGRTSHKNQSDRLPTDNEISTIMRSGFNQPGLECRLGDTDLKSAPKC